MFWCPNKCQDLLARMLEVCVKRKAAVCRVDVEVDSSRGTGFRFLVEFEVFEEVEEGSARNCE